MKAKAFSEKTCQICGKKFIPVVACQKICKEDHYVSCPICGKRIVHNSLQPIKCCSKKCSNILISKSESYRLQEISTIDNSNKIKRLRDSIIDENAILSELTISKRDEFAEFLTMNHIEFESNFYIDDIQYDFHITGTNILIDLDVTEFHNSLRTCFSDTGLSRGYHLSKTRFTELNRYRLIHVFDWDDWNKILGLIVTSNKKINAEECEIYVLENKTMINKFLNENHVLGTCRGQKFCIGLVYENELYQIITFSKYKYNDKYDVELKRMCTKIGYSIPGGYKKLLKYANYFSLGNIITFCDISKFACDVYEDLGLSFLKLNPRPKLWSKGNKYKSNVSIRYKENTMIDDGWLPIYGCGSAVYQSTSTYSK